MGAQRFAGCVSHAGSSRRDSIVTRTAFLSVVATTLFAVGFGRPAAAGFVAESEPNNTLATADNIDGSFTTDFHPFIENSSGTNTSTSIPHSSYSGNGFADLGSTYDYFSFNVLFDGAIGIFDVDSSSAQSNTELYLFDAAGNLLAENDDNTVIDNGSVTTFDPFLEYTFATAGLYIVGLGGLGSSAGPGGITGPGLSAFDSYTVNVSVSSAPEPASLLLFGAGTAGLVYYRRRHSNSTSASSADQQAG